MNTTINININGSAVLDQAMRRTRDHWPLAYSKLLAMEWVTTRSTTYGATDGRQLLLNPDGLAKLDRTSDPVGLTAFLLVHEALHALLSHGARLSKLVDHSTANIAADYVINAMIKRRNLEVRKVSGIVPFPFIDGILFDESISADYSAEELYQRLLKGEPPQPQPQPQPQPAKPDENDAGDEGEDDAGDEGDADEGEGDADEGDEGEGEGDADEGDAWDEGDAGDEGAGSGAGDDADDADESESESESEGAGGGQASGKENATDREILGDEWVGTGAVDTMQPKARDGETVEEAIDAVEASNESILLADQVDTRAGMDGAGGSREIQQQRARTGGLDWSEVLRQWLTARCASGWDKPFNAPIFTSTGTVSAGRQRKALPEIVVVVDTSASVPDSLLQEMLAQLQHCLDTMRPECIHLLSADWAVREAFELREGDTVPTKLVGGGGTMFAPAFRWVAENCPHAEGMVYLTDGDAWDWQAVYEPTCPVLWLDYGTRGASAYPFGEVVSFSRR